MAHTIQQCIPPLLAREWERWAVGLRQEQAAPRLVVPEVAELLPQDPLLVARPPPSAGPRAGESSVSTSDSCTHYVSKVLVDKQLREFSSRASGIVRGGT